MSRLIICLIVLVLLGSCSSFENSRKSLVYRPTGPVLLVSGISTVVLSATSHLVIQVPSNPSTGFRWFLNLPPKAANCLIVLRDGVFVKDTPSNHSIPQIGAPGLQEWEILANNCPGIYVLQWHNIRPWEKEQLPITTYQIRLEILPS